MSEQTPQTEPISFCQTKINDYKRDARFHCIAFFTSQIAAVFLSGITPILIILQVPDSVKAAAPALASIAGGLSVYRWKENWIRCESTSEKLQAELLKFNSVQYAEENEKTTETQKFLTKILEINDAHLKQWQTENEVEPAKKEVASS
jgi:hypothetical protein